MIMFLTEWFFFILGMVLLLPAFGLLDSKSFGKSSLFMAASVAAVSWFFWGEITTIVAQVGTVRAITVLATGYILAGVLTAFIYWIFFCWKAKERFQRELKSDEPYRLSRGEEALKKYAGFDLASLSTEQRDRIYVLLSKQRVIADNSAIEKIFDGAIDRFSIPVGSSFDWSTPAALEASIEAKIARVLPPRFVTCKEYVVWSGVIWPLTLIWLLCSRVVKQLIERFVTLFGSTFDAISKLAFGKV